ncbi:hsp70-binding protein 1 [Onthophagus taurus]|uniref:hsp70-binding protein 1 n=1 Tax=Onthophagus taurus TaxID=166361 RepID=UPI000C20D411|nr:hsp70 nucleotide exchange factor FES1 [Onthophagus taurus]
MPGVLKKPQQSLMLTSEVENAPSNQPRQQPTSLEGLLRFAVEATRREDGAGPSNFAPMEEEKRKFLEDALKSMTIDVIEILVNQIKTFDNVGNVSEVDDVTEYIQAFETICDYVDNIDIANDFYKIGGFSIIRPCLESKHSELKLRAADLLAELCQNNIFCQNVAINHGFLQILVPMLKETDFNVVAKVIYAISCIIRENPPGLHLFDGLQGFENIKEPLLNMDERTRKKSAFLLVALCNMDGNIKEKIISLDYINEIVTILMNEYQTSFEDCGMLLQTLIEDNESGISVCRGHEEFEEFLKNHIEFTENKDEYIEANAIYKNLLRQIFPEGN